MQSLTLTAAAALIVAVLGLTTASAHITPPRVLLSDAAARQVLVPEARSFTVRELRLLSADRRAIRQQWGWIPDETRYDLHEGRDAQGRTVGTVVFLGEITIHGPVRIAVGIGADGKIAGARVVGVSEESHVWVKPLVDRDFPNQFNGQTSHGDFRAGPKADKMVRESMAKFYAEILANLVQRGAILYEYRSKGTAR